MHIAVGSDTLMVVSSSTITWPNDLESVQHIHLQYYYYDSDNNCTISYVLILLLQYENFTSTHFLLKREREGMELEEVSCIVFFPSSHLKFDTYNN